METVNVKEDTKGKILEKALELFSERGYDSVSVDEIAKAVGIKAPSLYNHYSGKKAIFYAIVRETEKIYDNDTDKFSIHVGDSGKDVAIFSEISEDALFEKARLVFEYSLNNDKIRRFRKMMTIEQFRSEELAKLYTERFVSRIISYHADIFRYLIKLGEIADQDPEMLAYSYVCPILTLIGICDRQPEREAECLLKLRAHVKLFFTTYNVNGGKSK